MLDEFLKVAFQRETAREQSVKLASSMSNLSKEELYSLATGQTKLAFGHEESGEWLEKYKDTPLFDQAVQLERADLENEVARSQASAAQPSMDQFWKTQEHIRIQKKMLDLQFIEQGQGPGPAMLAGGMLPETTPTAQGAGALGDVAAEGPGDGAMTGPKMASAKLADLNQLRALQHMRPYMDDAHWNSPPGASEQDMAELTHDIATSEHGGMKRKADFAEQHPIMHHLPGVLAGGLGGGLAGGSIASSLGASVGGGAALGALGGGLLGGMMTPGARTLRNNEQELGGHLKHVDMAQLANAMRGHKEEMAVQAAHERARAVAEAGAMKQNITTNVHSGGRGSSLDDDDDDDYGYAFGAKKKASANFAKAAFDLKGLGGAAMQAVKANPVRAMTAAGAGVGALAGAATARRDPQTGEKHYLAGAAKGALGGAALGAGAGLATKHVLPGYQTARATGQTVGESLKGSVGAAADKLRAAVGGGAPGSAVSAPGGQLATSGSTSAPGWSDANEYKSPRIRGKAQGPTPVTPETAGYRPTTNSPQDFGVGGQSLRKRWDVSPSIPTRTVTASARFNRALEALRG